MSSGVGFTKIDLVILIVYLAAVLLVGIVFSKKDMKGKEFFKGDGTIPWWVTSVSIFATLLSPISFLSLAGNSYADTWLLWFAQLGLFIAVPLTIKFFLPIYSRLDIDTAYHYLELRFGSKGLRILGAVMFIIYQVGRMSIIMFLPCIALAPLMKINVNILIVVMGVIAIVYSYTGGIKPVLWTDFTQGAILIAGVVFALIYLITQIDGGFPVILDQLTHNGKFLSPEQHFFDINIFKTSAFIILVGSGFNTFASFVSSQDIVQRFTTTTDRKQLNKMMLTNGVLSLFIATVFYLIGTGLSVFYANDPSVADVTRDKIFAHYIAYELPVGITGIVLAAIYAAAQSTLSTGLNSVATSWSLDIQPFIKEDISEAQQTKLAQYISLGVGILTIIVAMLLANGNIKSAYETFNAFMGLVLGVLVGIFVLGAFTKSANAKGTFIAFIAASIVIIFIKYKVPSITSWSYAIISIVLSLVVGLIASKFFKQNSNINEKATIYYKE